MPMLALTAGTVLLVLEWPGGWSFWTIVAAGSILLGLVGLASPRQRDRR